METNSLLPLLPRATDKLKMKKCTWLGWVVKRDLPGSWLLQGDLLWLRMSPGSPTVGPGVPMSGLHSNSPLGAPVG